MTTNNTERPWRPQGKIKQQQTKHEENLTALDKMHKEKLSAKRVWSWSDRHQTDTAKQDERKKNSAHQSRAPGAGPPEGPAPGAPAQQYNTTHTTWSSHARNKLTQKTWEQRGIGSNPNNRVRPREARIKLSPDRLERRENKAETSNRAVPPLLPPPFKGHKKHEAFLPKTQFYRAI